MINSSDILQLCRLCLVEDKVNHSIFEESGDLRSIPHKISSCLPVSIRKDDSLPKKICDTCSTKLDSFYEFWSESANAEKQLLQWLKQTTTLKQNQADSNKKMDTTEVKKEVEDTMDPIDMSSEAQTYILQQQKLPYTSTLTDSIHKECDEPLSKRPRRVSATTALENMGSDDEDDADLGTDNYAKSETDDSDGKDEEEDGHFPENPATSDDQPGPSGIKKKLVLDDTPVFTLPKVKPCHVIVNDIKGLLDENGIYIVPGRSRRNLTCYRCFKKFDSAESLEIHKAEHEPESEEDNIYAVSDSEIEIESESDEEKRKVGSVDLISNSISKPPNKLVVIDKRIPQPQVMKEPKTEFVQRPPETAKQIQIVEPMRAQPTPNVIAKVVVASPQANKPKEAEEEKKVPVLCNIQIRCLTCDILFTNSELLTKHEPQKDKPCCFTCKVCSESYSMPADYLNHIMQHNTFSSSRYGYRGQSRKKPEYRCTYCRQEFEHRFMLKQHEEKNHSQNLVNHVVIPEQVKKPVELPTPTLPVIAVEKAPIEIDVNVEEPVTEVKPSEETTVTHKPKIWVIKEAMMKSPEPPVPPPNAIVSSSGVKRKLDAVEMLNDLIKPGKRGRPAKTATTQSVFLPPNPGVQTASLTCDICLDVFQNKAAFEEHMVFHNKGPEFVALKTEDPGDGFKCTTCNARFKSMPGLKRHQTCAHENQKLTSFVCANCCKIFSSRKGLNIHKNTCGIQDKRGQ